MCNSFFFLEWMRKRKCAEKYAKKKKKGVCQWAAVVIEQAECFTGGR